MAYVFDGAYAAPVIAACKQAGGVAMVHYLTGKYETSSPQIEATRSAGMGAVLNFEESTDLFLRAGTGADAASRSVARALGHGAPTDGTVAIYYSVDVNTPASAFGTVAANFRQVQQVHNGRFATKAYGQQVLIDYLCAQHVVDGRQWLSMSTFGQPYNPASQNVCAVQGHDIHGNWLNSPVMSTDVNTVTSMAELRAWWPGGLVFTGGNYMFEIIQSGGAEYIWSPAGVFWHIGNAAQASALAASKLCAGVRAVSAADLATLTAVANLQVESDVAAAHLDHIATLLEYGDSEAAAQGKVAQGHPYNNYNMWEQLNALASNVTKAQTQLMALGQISTAITSLQAAVANVGTATVDVAALTAALAPALGASLAQQVVQALGADIVKGAGQ